MSEKTSAWNGLINILDNRMIDYRIASDSIYIHDVGYDQISGIMDYVSKHRNYLTIRVNDFDVVVSYR